jgi:hypothetical protein
MKRSSWLILVLAGLIHVGMLVGWRFQTPLVPYFFDATVLSGGRGLDFYSMYQAGYNARHGQDIYEGDPAKISVVVPYFTPYRYLPPDAYTLGAALSLLPPLRAYELWVVLVELTLLACAAGSFYVARATPDLAARLAAMWLVFSPYYLELFMGQFSLVQAALIFVMLLAANQTPTVSWSFDGAWIASILWKINTVVFGPVLVRLRRWRALVAAGLSTAAVTLPYFTIFPAHLGDFLNNNFGNTVAGHELGNLGLRQLVYELLAVVGAGAGAQQTAQVMLIVAVGLTALALTFWPRRARPPVVDLLCLWLVAFFLISPQVWEHHYVMLLPALVLAYWQRPGWWVLVIWLLLALPTTFRFTALQPAIAANHDLRGFMLAPAWPLVLEHASKALPALALFAYFAVKIAAIPGEAGGIIARGVSAGTIPQNANT